MTTEPKSKTVPDAQWNDAVNFLMSGGRAAAPT